jgi:hypothetical protein
MDLYQWSDGPVSQSRAICLQLITVSHIGLQSAVDAISQVFKRPVLGIHNET